MSMPTTPLLAQTHHRISTGERFPHWTNRLLNVVVCAVVLFVSIYLATLALFHRRFLDPLQNVTVAQPVYVDYGHSAVSTVIIWIAAVILGYLTHVIRLPALLGVLLCGILFRNIPAVSGHIFIDDGLNAFLRKAAFTVILIRGGIGLDPEALKKCKGAITRLGVISPVVEAVIITVLAIVIFHMDVRLSFVFGMTLAATSPAVTIPTMLGLNKKGYGTQSGVPTVLLAAAAIDNMICLTFANIFLAVIFSKQSIAAMIGLVVLQIIVGIVTGLCFGCFLWWFPRKTSRQLHFTRGLMLQCLSLAFIFGGQATDWYSAGVIATILCSIVASVRWKSDNDKKANKESESFALMWNLVGMQVMFVLIGYEFLLSALRLNVVLKGIGILVAAVVVRIVTVFCLSLCGGFNRKEQTFMSLSFFPKATVQAALVPQIIEECIGTEYEAEAQIIMQICVLAILITAPLGQFILQLYGPFALGKDPRYRDDNGDEEIVVPETLDPGVLKGENVLNLPIGSLKSPQNAKTDRSKLNDTFLP